MVAAEYDNHPYAPTDLWEGWDELTEPPEDAADTSVTPQERKEVDLAEFWRARPVLTHLHEFAKARRVGPWAVLGSALARVITMTPPAVVLPPIVGGAASLNLFVGLVGKSGTGKDAAQKTAKVALTSDAAWTAYLEAPLGSGEGLSHMFMKPVKPVRGGGDDQPTSEQYNQKALVRIGEIDTLNAQQSRQASTLSAQLRMAAMGEELGAFYVDLAKRMIVPAHQYRLCIVAGIQPARSAVLLDDADGGTPQRWIWMPAGDPTAQREVPEPPEPLLWEPPDLMSSPRYVENGLTFFEVGLPDVAMEAVIAARVQSQREEDATGLDSHALLTRCKVAAGLALMEGRIVVTEDDWHLSGAIMALSDAQRARCQKAVGQMAAVANRAKAYAEAERTVVIDERLDQERRARVGRSLKRRLAREGSAGLAAGQLRKTLESRDREMFESVIDSLIVAGEVRVEESPRGIRYALI